MGQHAERREHSYNFICLAMLPCLEGALTSLIDSTAPLTFLLACATISLALPLIGWSTHRHFNSQG